MSPPIDPDDAQATPWREAAAEFVSARLELFTLEAREASQRAARKAALLAFAAGCGVTFWLCFVAGVIGWIAASGHPWHFVALACAAFHLVAAGIAVAVIRRPGPPSFPLSRAEFEKDRQWLSQTQETPKP